MNEMESVVANVSHEARRRVLAGEELGLVHMCQLRHFDPTFHLYSDLPWNMAVARFRRVLASGDEAERLEGADGTDVERESHIWSFRWSRRLGAGEGAGVAGLICRRDTRPECEGVLRRGWTFPLHFMVGSRRRFPRLHEVLRDAS